MYRLRLPQEPEENFLSSASHEDGQNSCRSHPPISVRRDGEAAVSRENAAGRHFHHPLGMFLHPDLPIRRMLQLPNRRDLL